MLTMGSLFSGIGAAELAAERAGITTLWASEIVPQAAGVHARHFPRTYQLGDINHAGKHNAAPVDIICGGSPCQDLSIAGNRAGLAGVRSGLFFEYIRVIRELRPAFAVWENVPGALSSHNGRDFARVLSAFHELRAHDIAWRVLDAQYFGVPQRRRRIFLVADFRGQRAGEILFEPESAGRYRQARKEAGADIAFALTGGNQRLDASNNETFIGVTAFNARNNGTNNRIAGTLQARAARGSLNATPLIAGTLRNAMARNGGIGGGIDQDLLVPAKAGTLTANPANQSGATDQGNYADFLIAEKIRVRRLTPVECERLQGFPDRWTQWDEYGRELADTPRYRMLGNSMAVPVMEWILRRMVEAF